MPAVNFPTGVFPVANSSGVLGLGKVYIGEVDADPTVEGNRINVTVIQEDGTPVVIPPNAQPFVLNAGGQFTYEGSVVQLRVDQNYSMSVLSSADVQNFYFPSVASGEVLISSTIQLVPLLADPDPIAGSGQIYGKTVSSIVEMFYMDSEGNVIQFTTGGSLKVELPDASLVVSALSATGESYAGYFTGGVQNLVITGGEIALDWASGQYFRWTNTEAHTVTFSNLPLIDEGKGQTILLFVEDAGNFAIQLDPELGYTIYVPANYDPVFTTDGIDLFVITVPAASIIAMGAIRNLTPLA